MIDAPTQICLYPDDKKIEMPASLETQAQVFAHTQIYLISHDDHRIAIKEYENGAPIGIIDSLTSPFARLILNQSDRLHTTLMDTFATHSVN